MSATVTSFPPILSTQEEELEAKRKKGLVSPMSTTVTSLPIQMIPIESLSESPWNPRQVFPEAALNELVESMKASGFRPWLPLMVRPHPADLTYEIGAGHRRRRAAELAGIKEIPCIVREMSDEEFLDVLNFDNSGREDVHPLHEAAGWQQWMEKTGKGVLDIAARIGQSKEYVYQRLKYAALIDAGKAAFLNGEITAGHAILIARLQPKDQDKSLKYCLTVGYSGHKPSVRDLVNFIQRDIHLEMADAPFDLASVELVPAAGSCIVCPKRTKNSPELILAVEYAQRDGPTEPIDDCTDPACFTAKVDAHLVQIERKLKAAGKDPIYVSDSWSKAPKGVLIRSDYQTVKEGTPGARTAIVGQGHEAGKVIHIKVTPKAPSPKGETPEQKKAAEEKQKIATERELSIRREILKAIRPKISGLTRPDIEWLLMDLLHNGEADELARLHGLKFNSYQGNQAIEIAIPKMSEAELFQLAVELPVMEELKGWAITRNESPARLLALAKRHKVDAAKIRADIEKVGAPPSDKKPPVVPPAKKKTAKPAVKSSSGKRGMIKGKK